VHIVVSAYSSESTATTCVLFDLSTGTAVQRGTYTATTYTPVMFRQFDNEMFAARAGSEMKRAAYGGDFTAVSGAPSCSLIEATRDFMLAFDTSDGYDWQCSAIGNALDWALSVSTQAVRGKFFGKAGPVVAAAQFAEYVMAFTNSQTYLGRYVGAPEVWQWEQISRDVGCVGPEAVCSTPFGTCWVGRNDVYVYDGQAVTPLNTQGTRQTIFATVDTTKIQHAQAAWDRKNGLLWLFFAMASTGTSYAGRLQSYAYHFESKRWVDSPLSEGVVLAANQMQTPEYFDIGGPTTTQGDFLYCSAFPSPSDITLRKLISTSRTRTGFVETGVFGDPVRASMVKSVRPIYAARGTAVAECLLSTQLKSPDGGATATSTATLDADFKFPFRQTGRWHSMYLYLKQTDALKSVDIDFVLLGNR
jgi:hypothetical protein